jgi:hypothetical protein
VLRQVDQSGLQLSNAGSGQVKLARHVSVLGRTYAVVARGRVESKGNRLLVTPTSFALAGGGAVDKGLSRLLGDRFTFSYRIRGLPGGVHLDRITLPTTASSSTSRVATSGWSPEHPHFVKVAAKR